MSGFAQTVIGLVPASELGWTLMHEHVLCDLRDPMLIGEARQGTLIEPSNRFQTDYFQNRNPNNMVLDEWDVAQRELALFRQAGGQTIVELTVGGLNPRPEALADLCRDTGVWLIMGAGLYTAAYCSPSQLSASVEDLEALILNQLRDGAGGSAIKAGLIGEVGCSWPLAEIERRQLVAAARIQAATGVPITIHPGRHPDAPAQIAEILLTSGADPSLTIIGHIDRTIFDRGRIDDLLRMGFVLEWDFFGIETSQYWMAGEDLDLPTDYMRLDLIRDLVRAGHIGQIAISHDICTKTRLCSYGGHGYHHLISNIVPMMLRRGFSEEHVEQILRQTPARLLGYLTGASTVKSEVSNP